MAEAPVWAETAKGVAAIAQIFAVTVGGLWAFFKFRRSKLFVPRVEWTLSGAYVHCDGQHGVKVTASLRNPGHSDLEFTVAALGLFAMDSDQWSDLPFMAYRDEVPEPMRDEEIDFVYASDSWGPPLREPIRIFENDVFVRSGETITNQYLVRDPRPGERAPLAYKVVTAVQSTRSGDWWATSLVVPARLLESRAAS